MQEHDDHTPEAILRLKDTILDAFRALPPEHQATLSLVLTKTVADGEWGTWLRDALVRQYSLSPNELPHAVPLVTRRHLDQAGFTKDEIRQFTDDELTTIRSLIFEHFLSDVFLDEVTFIGDLMLEQKRKESAEPTTP